MDLYARLLNLSIASTTAFCTDPGKHNQQISGTAGEPQI